MSCDALTACLDPRASSRPGGTVLFTQIVLPSPRKPASFHTGIFQRNGLRVASQSAFGLRLPRLVRASLMAPTRVPGLPAMGLLVASVTALARSRAARLLVGSPADSLPHV